MKFGWAFLYWAKTGRNGWGYILDKRDYHHALDRLKEEEILKTEMEEMENMYDEETRL